jgi:Bacterial Ig-like domain (group 3)
MLHTASRRLGAVVAAGALSAGALVAMTAPAAQAAPATTTYSCGITGVAGPYNVVVTTDVPGLPSFVPAGLDVPAGLLNVTNKVVIPKAARDLFASLQVTKVDLPDMALEVGDESVLATGLTAPTSQFVASADGTTYSADINGKNAAFNAPAQGTNPVTQPEKFTIRATRADGTTADVPCAVAAGSVPGVIASVTTAENVSTTKAKPAKKVTPLGKKTKVKVVVSAENEVPTGKVKVMEGKKVLGKGELNSKGKVTVTLKKALPKGKTVVKVLYRGDSYTESSRDKKVVLKVR